MSVLLVKKEVMLKDVKILLNSSMTKESSHTIPDSGWCFLFM